MPRLFRRGIVFSFRNRGPVEPKPVVSRRCKGVKAITLDAERSGNTDKGGYSVDPQRAWRMERRVTIVLRFALCSMLLQVSIRNAAFNVKTLWARKIRKLRIRADTAPSRNRHKFYLLFRMLSVFQPN